MTTIWSEEKLEQWATMWIDTQTRKEVATIAEKRIYWEGQLAVCNEELESEPGDRDLWYQQGVILKFLGKLDEAMDSFKCVLRLDSNMEEAWWQLGSISFEMGKKEDAILAFDHKLSLIPQSFTNALNTFLSNESEVVEACIKSTKASYGYYGYFLEIFDNGNYRHLSTDSMENLYDSQGILIPIPSFPDEIDIEGEIDPVDLDNLIEIIKTNYQEYWM